MREMEHHHSHHGTNTTRAMALQEGGTHLVGQVRGPVKNDSKLYSFSDQENDIISKQDSTFWRQWDAGFSAGYIDFEGVGEENFPLPFMVLLAGLRIKVT